jgi:hypothetical protein
VHRSYLNSSSVKPSRSAMSGPASVSRFPSWLWGEPLVTLDNARLLQETYCTVYTRLFKKDMEGEEVGNGKKRSSNSSYLLVNR